MCRMIKHILLVQKKFMEWTHTTMAIVKHVPMVPSGDHFRPPKIGKNGIQNPPKVENYHPKLTYNTTIKTNACYCWNPNYDG